MKRVGAFLAMILSLFLLSLGANLAQDQSLKFNRLEIESLLYFFNEANIKGSEIEIWAALSQKLKEGQKEANAFVDTTQTVSVNLISQEAKLCIDVINNATFQAKWVELVLGIKRKLEKIAPSSSNLPARD